MSQGQRSKRSGDAYRQYYIKYHERAPVNRRARQERHMAKHPNDNQEVSTQYRRQKPKAKGGWLTRKQLSKLDMTAAIDPESGGRVQGRKAQKQLAQAYKHARSVARQMQYDPEIAVQQPKNHPKVSETSNQS